MDSLVNNTDNYNDYHHLLRHADSTQNTIIHKH